MCDNSILILYHPWFKIKRILFSYIIQSLINYKEKSIFYYTIIDSILRELYPYTIQSMIQDEENSILILKILDSRSWEFYPLIIQFLIQDKENSILLLYNPSFNIKRILSLYYTIFDSKYREFYTSIHTSLYSRWCEFYLLIIQPLIQDEDNNVIFQEFKKKDFIKTENNILLHLSNFQGSIKTIFTTNKECSLRRKNHAVLCQLLL